MPGFIRGLALAICATILLGLPPSATATPPGGSGTTRYGQSQQKGFDSRCAPSASAMNTWWYNSLYWDVGIYIGGVNRSCSPNSNLTQGWVTNTHNDSLWSFYLIWVGLQAPCSSYASRMSYDAATATDQGRAAADNSVSAAAGLGFTGNNVYYFDMENYDTGNSSCRTAVHAFVNGWSARLNQYWSQKAGVYGSGCASAVDDWASGWAPDDVWIADWNNDPDVWGLGCVPNGHWVGGQRLHQYRGDTTRHTEVSNSTSTTTARTGL